MRRNLYLLPLLATLPACTSTAMLVHRTGSTIGERQMAIDECRITSLQQIPQALVTQNVGGYSNPGTLQCNTYGAVTSCNRVGAVNIPPTQITSDVNQSLRDRFVARCLTGKGFTLAPMKICASQVEKNAYRAIANNQPPLNQIHCASGDPI